MLLSLSSYLFFFFFEFVSLTGLQPHLAPFLRGSTRCCRKTNEKRARQLRTTKLRNIKKLADHLLGPELSETMRDAEKLIQKMSRERSTYFRCRKEHRRVKQAEHTSRILNAQRVYDIYRRLRMMFGVSYYQEARADSRAIFKGPQRTTPQTIRLYEITRSGKKCP